LAACGIMPHEGQAWKQILGACGDFRIETLDRQFS
jgi:hypothetical protein